MQNRSQGLDNPRNRKEYVDSVTENEWWQELVSDCCMIVSEGQSVVLKKKWQLGTRIIQDSELDFQTRNFAPMGEALIENLATEIRLETGSPCSKRDLYRCIQFAKAYDYETLCHSVSRLKSWHNVVNNILPEPKKQEPLAVQVPPMLIYVAMPLGNKYSSVVDAVRIGSQIWERGHYTYIPHLTLFQDRIIKRLSIEFKPDYEDWLKLGFEIIKRCDAIYYRSSPGADRERDYAEKIGKMVYTNIIDIPRVT